ncbi:MAG: type II toxin-antitoxin system HicB family antitoxin [Balneolales bacterium]
MKKTFSASITKEGNLYVARCIEVDVASQARTKGKALENLREALELHFEDPHATVIPEIRQLDIDHNAS